MTDFICPRCGKALTQEKQIDLNGYVVTVCERCHKYLKQNFDALMRFKTLQKNKENNKMPRISTFTPEMDELLIRSYEANERPDDIATKLGVPTRTVYDRASYLRKCGALPKPETEDAETDKPDEPESTTEEPVEEKPTEADKLRDHVTALMDERDKLLKENYKLREEIDAKTATMADLTNELRDTHTALEETELQFDAYRAEKENGSEILEKLIQKHTELLDEAARIDMAIEMIGKYGEGGE